jgi:hypothetical protein
MLRFFRAGPEPSPAQPRSKRERRPATAAEIATWRLGEARNRRHRIQNGLKIDIQLLMPALPKIPSRILGHRKTLRGHDFMTYNKCRTGAEGRELWLERRIDAPPARLFGAWTQRELIRRWFTPPPFGQSAPPRPICESAARLESSCAARTERNSKISASISNPPFDGRQQERS